MYDDMPTPPPPSTEQGEAGENDDLYERVVQQVLDDESGTEAPGEAVTPDAATGDDTPEEVPVPEPVAEEVAVPEPASEEMPVPEPGGGEGREEEAASNDTSSQQRNAPEASTHMDTVGVALFGDHAHADVVQQFHLKDTLEPYPFTRENVLDDPTFVQVPAWSHAIHAAKENLPHSPVLVVNASRGHGATTFARHLLAALPKDRTLCLLETSWDKPLVSRLPVAGKTACVLDLRTADHDQLDTAFLTGLGKHAGDLATAESCLVVLVSDGQWPAAVPAPARVQRIRLHGTPDGTAVATSLLDQQHRPRLRAIFEKAAGETLRTMPPGRVVWLVNQAIALEDAQVREAEGTGAGEEEQREKLSGAVERLVLGWEDMLSVQFADGRQQAALPQPRDAKSAPKVFDLEERCLSIALAIRGSGPALDVQNDARSLLRHLRNRPEKQARKGDGDLSSVLQGVGLGTRLKAIGADPGPGGEAAYTSPGYSDALLIHVWGDYHELRERLLDWAIACAAGDAAAQPRIVRALLKTIAYHQDDAPLKRLSCYAADPSTRAAAACVAGAAARHPHLGSRTRGLLYQWAGSSAPPTRLLAVDVCRSLPEEQRDAVLVRLRRAGEGAQPEVTGEVLGAFQEIVARPHLIAWFAGELVTWQEQDRSPSALALGMLALMGEMRDGVPWLLTDAAPRLDVAGALGTLLSRSDTCPRTLAVISRWLQQCPEGPLYDGVLSTVRNAFETRAGFKALATVMLHLAHVERPDGSPADRRLKNLLSQDPDVRALLPEPETAE
ncbi:hypothetical protein SCA03_61650 [Streptomyces cacaoi]|uniref:Uncharacterized protein n=2 Tax=Streptomyces cacaoi TaxID=1898 RepID=A0A4Y3R7R8_STRCI|nr:hypothetical protein SCA03_61650 [Streptomyces cacaoi]